MRKLITIVVVPILIGLAVVAIGWSYVSGRGVSAREEPSEIEKVVARRMRHLAIPRGAREQQNPVASSPEVIEEGLAHFADHCAICHANDGSGDSEIGRNLYPKPPDMRATDTQSLTDGELFYIIQNGVRLTGMPAWGGRHGEDAHETWHLVHFIRHLPKLTPEERARMAQLNPKTADEWRAEEEARKAAEGAGAGKPTPPAAKPHSHTHTKPHQR
jgi:mono/diheme cytochrome c family protein